MKKISLIILVILIFSCKDNKNNISYENVKVNNEQYIENKQDTIIENISKNCEETQKRNISEYYLCKEWKMLDEKIIKKIIKSGELGDGGEGDSRALHYTTSELPIWITADMLIGNLKYKISINGSSYFYITNQKNKTSLYFCKNIKYRNYFISGIGTEDDELYEKLRFKINNKIKTLETDLNSWQGTYDFDNGNYEQGHRNYHIKIEKNNCIFYQGKLPAYQTNCETIIINNELFLYLKSEIPKVSDYDTTYLQNLQQGDYLLKIFKIKNKYFINSKLIKYWDDSKNEFIENHNIEIVK